METDQPAAKNFEVERELLRAISVVICSAFLFLNLSLACAVHEAQTLYNQETATMGRELKGTGLEPAYHRVNAYYERHNGSAFLIYWFGPIAKPLAIISIVTSLFFACALRKCLRAYSLIPLFLSITLLWFFNHHERAIGLFAAWLE